MRPLFSLLSGIAFVAAGMAHAAVLDTVHSTTHHARPQHLVETHRAAHRAHHATASTAAHSVSKAAPAHTRTARRSVSSAKVGNGATTIRRVSLHARRHHYYERFTASSFATADELSGDVTTGEDPVVRQAAMDALGDMNGTAVVIDPSNGRILAMVNQKLALSPGAEPCSTIKITVAMAALSEGLVTRDTMVRLPGFRMNLTQALAKSNNLYFEELGRELGFDRVKHYANEFGLGELAGWNIPGEQLGTYPDRPIPESEGGVGKMCSFGQGVSLTPLQLGAYVAALANGGTLYYLQHPTTPEDIAAFQPRVKRTLDIAKYLPEIQDGMAGAVEYGTARRLRTSFTEFPVFGKTGTCSNEGTRFGWFASYSQAPQGSLVTVFFLEGGRPTFGPRAAELTGAFYRNLWDHNYFQDKPVQATASNSPAGGSNSGANQ
ncbi:MAG TPA: penicillin-binding transpeptidase domain-containing protein [Terracidiphilus sp.]|jgi:membrane carboxypeptidase/penicillin-binding protein|nr:penicillin-binding transpeptidase domain-containing protein [Terracidiphilus sp.]